MQNFLRNISFGLILVLFACGNGLAESTDKDDSFTIDASINLEPGTRVVVTKITATAVKPIDTVLIDQNKRFHIEGSEQQSTIYYLTFMTANPPGVPLIVENGAKIEMDIVKGTGYKFTVTGGKYNESMYRLHELYTGYDDRVRSFDKEVKGMDPKSITPQMQQQVNLQYQNIFLQRSQDIEQFIKDEPVSPALFFAVKYLFTKPETRLIMLAADRMEVDLPGSMYTTELVKLRDRLGALVEGAIAPNIKLPGPDGDSIELHSLRGKVVLIDFWASWCGPCRKENPHVVELYNKYKDKGFEIYGVSLDQNAAQWKAAIAKDSLTWYHVSDLKGWRSSAAKLYNVGSIPQTYLIDQEGRIYKVGLRSAQLETVLESLLN